MARVGTAFDMSVGAWSPNLTRERCDEVGVELLSKEELFSTADVVTIHLILSERSRHTVGPDEIGRMKPNAILVNTSRGPLVDEAALARGPPQRGHRRRRASTCTARSPSRRTTPCAPPPTRC